MSFTNYTTLKAALANTLERDDLTTAIEDFIRLAEARIRRDIRIPEMINRDSITVNARQIAKPTGYLESIELRLLTDPVTVLQDVSVHEMSRLRSEGTGKPTRFTIHTEIEFDVTPDSSYSGEIVFYKKFDPLETTATNDLLTNHPDIYYYGALIESAPYLMHDERITIWAQLYREAKDSANKMGRKSRRSGPQVPQVVGRGP